MLGGLHSFIYRLMTGQSLVIDETLDFDGLHILYDLRPIKLDETAFRISRKAKKANIKAQKYA